MRLNAIDVLAPLIAVMGSVTVGFIMWTTRVQLEVAHPENRAHTVFCLERAAKLANLIDRKIYTPYGPTNVFLWCMDDEMPELFEFTDIDE